MPRLPPRREIRDGNARARPRASIRWPRRRRPRERRRRRSRRGTPPPASPMSVRVVV